MPSSPWLPLALIALCTAASVTDLALRRIPNRLLLAALASATLLHLVAPAPLAGLASGLAGLATGLCLFLPLYLLRGMAAGDVKLMATVGAFTGPLLALQIGLATFCIGGLMSLAIVLVRGQTAAALGNVRALLRPLLLRVRGAPPAPAAAAPASVGSMPYGLAIALGTFALLWWRHM